MFIEIIDIVICLVTWQDYISELLRTLLHLMWLWDLVKFFSNNDKMAFFSLAYTIYVLRNCLLYYLNYTLHLTDSFGWSKKFHFFEQEKKLFLNRCPILVKYYAFRKKISPVNFLMINPTNNQLPLPKKLEHHDWLIKSQHATTKK